MVAAHGGGLPGPALRQLHLQLAGRPPLQCHHPSAQVGGPGGGERGCGSEVPWSSSAGDFRLVRAGRVAEGRLPLTGTLCPWAGVPGSASSLGGAGQPQPHPAHLPLGPSRHPGLPQGQRASGLLLLTAMSACSMWMDAPEGVWVAGLCWRGPQTRDVGPSGQVVVGSPARLEPSDPCTPPAPVPPVGPSALGTGPKVQRAICVGKAGH